MLINLFTYLTEAISGSPFVALPAVFIWGFLSIVLSPCHLSSIPLVIGFLSGQKDLNIKKTFVYTLLFASGILLSIVIIGLITGLLGRILGDIGPYGNIIMAIIFFMTGLNLLRIMPLPFLNKINQPQYQRKGFLSAFILGLFFGVAVGPCTFAYMAPILGIVFKVASTSFIYASNLVLLYATGHSIIIILAGISFEVVEKFLKLNEESISVNIIKNVCGILIILGGIYLLLDALKVLGMLKI